MVAIPEQAIRDAQSADAELWPVLLAIAGPESTWRSDAVGDAGCSVGYLQMNRCGGLGVGYSVEQLKDGRFNMALGAQHIRTELAAGRGLYDTLWPWVARPQAWALLPEIQAQYGGQVVRPASPAGNLVPLAMLLVAVIVVNRLV